jgi:hypothetical protein
MHWRTAIIPILMVLAAALGAGCTGTSPGPSPTPTPGMTVTVPPTTMATTPAVTPVNCLAPAPTELPDPRYEIQVDVIRNPVSLNKQITVTFQGGKGQLLTSRVDVTITREDCTTETKSITRPESGSIQKGNSVTFNGSNRDRVQVTATVNGAPYTIVDQIYQYQARL